MVQHALRLELAAMKTKMPSRFARTGKDSVGVTAMTPDMYTWRPVSPVEYLSCAASPSLSADSSC